MSCVLCSWVCGVGHSHKVILKGNALGQNCTGFRMVALQMGWIVRNCFALYHIVS